MLGSEFRLSDQNMAGVEAGYQSEIEFLWKKCPASGIFDKYEYVDYERQVKASRVSELASISKKLRKQSSYERYDLLNRELSEHIASKLLTDNCSPIEISPSILLKMNKVERDLQNTTDEFSFIMSKWLMRRKENIFALRRLDHNFRLIHRTTTGITFVSSAVEFAVGLGLVLKDIFNLDIHLKVPLVVVPLISGFNITSSILALSYSKSTLDDITEGLRAEQRLRRDLEALYKKGKWVDMAVQDFFPFGIDLQLLRDVTTESPSWRHHLCSAIILTNLKKRLKVFDDEDFLPTVKAFVESPAAPIWLNRIKLRKLLDGMSNKCEDLTKEHLTSASEVFKSRVALNLYPFFFPLFSKSANTEKLRFIFSFVTVVKTAMDLMDHEDKNFQAIRDISLALKEDYKKIRKVNENLASDYD